MDPQEILSRISNNAFSMEPIVVINCVVIKSKTFFS